MSDIDTIRERHTPVVASSISGSHVCAVCLQPWPCDTRVVLDALDEVMADRDERASRHLDTEYDLVTRLSAAKEKE